MIQVLEGLEAVVKRPGMYIGSTSESEPAPLVYEIVGQTPLTRPWPALYDTPTTLNRATPHRHDKAGASTVDIPAQTGKTRLEVVFTILHAGGNSAAAAIRCRAAHGVGRVCCQRLSEWLEVQVPKNGEIYEMSCPGQNHRNAGGGKD